MDDYRLRADRCAALAWVIGALQSALNGGIWWRSPHLVLKVHYQQSANTVNVTLSANKNSTCSDLRVHRPLVPVTLR